MAQPTDPVQKPPEESASSDPAEKSFQSGLLGAMSSELHSPLNAILSQAELLEEGIYGPQTEQQHRALQSMIETSEQILALIQDAAVFSKLEAGVLRPQAAPMWVLGLCQASIRLARERSYQKEIRLDLQYDNQIEVILADEWFLRQILVNLLDAALQYTTEKGSVSLQVQGDASQNLIHFSVASSGGGIAQEDLVHLFEPFAQLKNSHPQSFGTGGLKLALVQRMVQVNQGSLVAQNQPGSRTLFVMTLPWSKPEPKARVQPDQGK